MKLTKEAAHLYLYSKKLKRINKEIKVQSKKVEKHKTKYERTKQDKHKIKHLNAKLKINKLLEKHKETITKLDKYKYAFKRALHKEHKL